VVSGRVISQMLALSTARLMHSGGDARVSRGVMVIFGSEGWVCID